MATHKSKSGKKSNRGVEIFLWVLLLLSVVGMVIALIFQCQSNNTPSPGPGKTSESFKSPHDPLERCEAECQANIHELGPLYPVRNPQPSVCNPATKSWLENSTPESIANLTKDQKGKRVICNRSCGQADSACGLDSSGIALGVM